MRRCLVLISLLLLLALPSLGEGLGVGFRVLMQVRGREVTGICLMDASPDGTIVGTIVNEMGVKTFDFTFDGRRARVLNVIGPINKWYIRRVLSGDFTFLLSNLRAGKDTTRKKRTLQFLPGGDIHMRNERYNIHYTFTPMNNGDEAHQ